ncbi:MAG TPA: metal ABC transporter substrate-binding protein [Acidimicrobiia bacterium]
MLLATVLLLTACGDEDRESDRLAVVTTSSIWGDVVAEIGGDDAEVEVLIPRNADAHDFQATSQQAARLLEADLVVVNGLGLEEGLQDVLDSAEGDGANVLHLAPLLDPIPFSADDRGDLDPHVWFDPQRVAVAAELIARELDAVDDSIDWVSRARTYADELATTEEEMRRLLSAVPDDRRKLVTNHQALGYLAERFEFEIVGVVIPGGSTLSDPSSAELAELVRTIEVEGIDVIFTETSLPSRLAEAVAEEVGREIEIVTLYTESLDDPGTTAGTLVGMMVENARRISDALG